MSPFPQKEKEKQITSKTREGDIEDQIRKGKTYSAMLTSQKLEISYPDLDPAESFILVEFELKLFDPITWSIFFFFSFLKHPNPFLKHPNPKIREILISIDPNQNITPWYGTTDLFLRFQSRH
ncbi:hypothetical protein CFP56_036664 [Quercus suber]|uniref:Uncharacterized protein n=1 Tax=Quercus suber TaxID=58331 RepID=A0AAW0MBA1_QUESU